MSDLHIWQLEGDRIIGSAHITCNNPNSYMDLARDIKDFFHNRGIHSTTIQPMFVEVSKCLLYLKDIYKCGNSKLIDCNSWFQANVR